MRWAHGFYRFDRKARILSTTSSTAALRRRSPSFTSSTAALRRRSPFPYEGKEQKGKEREFVHSLPMGRWREAQDEVGAWPVIGLAVKGVATQTIVPSPTEGKVARSAGRGGGRSLCRIGSEEYFLSAAPSFAVFADLREFPLFSQNRLTAGDNCTIIGI